MPAREAEVAIYDSDGSRKSFAEIKADAREAGITSPPGLASAIHSARSRKARIADESFRAVDTWESYPKERVVREWYAGPNRMDLAGVDTVATRHKEARAERVLEAFERGGLISGVIETDLPGAEMGRFVPEGEEQVEGRKEVQLDRASGAGDSSILAHELGHALDYELGGSFGGFGISADTIEDEDFAEDVKGASVERRGSFNEGNEYRNTPTEQFADWFERFVRTPRYTKAKHGSPVETIEEAAREKAGERFDRLAETPTNATWQKLQEAAIEKAERQGIEMDELYDALGESRERIETRFEEEGHRERLAERAEREREKLAGQDLTDPASLRDLPLGAISVEQDEFFEGSRPSDFIEDVDLKPVEDLLGEPIELQFRGS